MSIYPTYQTSLVGVTLYDCQNNICKWGNANAGNLSLEREPDNPYYTNAVKVVFKSEFLMGYLPEGVSEKFAPMMDAGMRFKVTFVKTYADFDDEHLDLYVNIDVT
jgi:hypothetical protein